MRVGSVVKATEEKGQLLPPRSADPLGAILGEWPSRRTFGRNWELRPPMLFNQDRMSNSDIRATKRKLDRDSSRCTNLAQN